MPRESTRVLVVDDSVFARKIVTDIISAAPNLTVAGTAANGVEGLAKVRELRPDVVTLDIEMPKMDGIETLRQLMAECPTPVVMVSSLTVSGARESMIALRLGAVDVMAKPHGSHSMGLTLQSDELIRKINAAAEVDIGRLAPLAAPVHAARLGSRPRFGQDFPIVMIASSTGGPRALRMVVPALSALSGAAFVAVQHIPEGFSAMLAQDLNEMSELTVREAKDGDRPEPGTLLLAKAGYHLVMSRARTLNLTLSPQLWGVRPSADVTMVSAAPLFAQRLVGVVLTGMGSDGAAGLKSIKERGGATIAEHESTCVVYGMPRVAIESGAVDIIAPIDKIPEAIEGAISSTARRIAA